MKWKYVERKALYGMASGDCGFHALKRDVKWLHSGNVHNKLRRVSFTFTYRDKIKNPYNHPIKENLNLILILSLEF